MKKWFKKLFDTKTTHGKIMRGLVFLFVILSILLIGYIVLKLTGLWDKVNSMEKIRQVVESGGVFSVLIFILLQILQTTVLQIPAVFVTIAGALVFGPWPAFFMSYFAILIGSIIMFFIGRKAGRKFLNWIVGKETADKWIKRMSGGKYLFFLMMIFPMFPDDILCVIAGLTSMSFPFFLWTNIIARALGLICTVFLGSGQIIPFRGWGLFVWAVILIFVAILFYLSIRYKEKIDQLLNAFFTKTSKYPKHKDSKISKIQIDKNLKNFENQSKNMKKFENFDENSNNLIKNRNFDNEIEKIESEIDAEIKGEEKENQNAKREKQ